MSKTTKPHRASALLKECVASVDPSDREATARAVSDFRRRVLEAAGESFSAARLGLPCSRYLAEAGDAIVQFCVSSIAESESAPSIRTAWIAAGGYGRGLLSPGSTLRLLLLHNDEDPAAAEQMANGTAALLRAAGWQAACAAQTVPQALGRMKDNASAAVSLLATRLLAGDKALYESFRRAVQDDFVAGCWGTFGEEALKEALAPRDPFTGSPYCVEPNLRDGAGLLRDVGLTQALNECLAAVPAFRADNGSPLLKPAEVKALASAGDFVRRVRNALHLTEGATSDVLHRTLCPAVAQRLGYKDTASQSAAERLLLDLFAHARRTTALLRSVDERFRHIHRVVWRGAEPSLGRGIGSGFVEVDGSLYSAVQPAFARGADAARMMTAFGLSQRRHLPLSQELLNQVSENLALVDDTFRADPAVGAAFTDLLAGGFGVADRIAWMRDCGLLAAYLPEMAEMVHAVDLGAAGDHTLDEHAVLALHALDDLGQSSEPGDLVHRSILEQVRRPDLVRLAVLLHDVEGDGFACVKAVAKRLGLRATDAADLAFLYEHRGLLWYHVRSGEADMASLAADLARAAGTPERLRMLYLLTYGRAQAVGSLDWFAWHEARLSEIYQATAAVFAPDYVPFATAAHFEREFTETAERADLAEAAARLLPLLPESYLIEVTPGEAIAHLALIQAVRSAPAAMTWSLTAHDATVWVCTSDVPARFAQIAAVFTHNGLDITSATAFTLQDGTVLDRFIVRRAGRPINPDPNFWHSVEQDLRAAIKGDFDVESAVRTRAAERAEGAVSSQRSLATVHVDNAASKHYTLVDVTARDRVGLLFELASAISSLGLDIELARIRTRGDLARDVFVVTEARTGSPLRGEARLAEVRDALTAAASGVA